MSPHRLACSLMTRKFFLTVSAVIELGAGLALLGSPAAAVVMLTEVPPENSAATLVARIAGAALLTLGVGCGITRNDAQSRTAKGLAAAMLFYDFAAAAVLAHAGMTLAMQGVLLWPGVVLHSVMFIWGVICIRRTCWPPTKALH